MHHNLASFVHFVSYKLEGREFGIQIKILIGVWQSIYFEPHLASSLMDGISHYTRQISLMSNTCDVKVHKGAMIIMPGARCTKSKLPWRRVKPRCSRRTDDWETTQAQAKIGPHLTQNSNKLTQKIFCFLILSLVLSGSQNDSEWKDIQLVASTVWCN